MLPAFPVRVACQFLGQEGVDDDELLQGESELLGNAVTKQEPLYPSLPPLTGMASAAGVFYNNSGDVGCFDLVGPNPEERETEDFWGYQYCTEMFQVCF